MTKQSSKKKSKETLSEKSPENRSKINHYFLFATVSITGAAVMMLEVLGTRIIGPFYGVSLIVWSSLISVTLMALAIGYFLGGKLADGKRRVGLSHILFASALFTGLIPLISQPVQSSMEELGLRGGALMSALILFGPPLTLLGMVGPFVIQSLAYRLDKVGSTSGNVYAISTCGSVVGTLLLGFFLIPIAGTRIIIGVLSITLFVLALCLMFLERRWQNYPKTIITPVVAFIAFAVVATTTMNNHPNREYRDYRVVSDKESHYGWVRVVDEIKTRTRWLLSDSSTIGSEDLVTGKSRLGYQQIVGLIPRFNPGGKDALLIGLGSGHLVNTLSRHNVKTDAIEIDPEVAEAAYRHFSFESSGEVHVGDARYQIKQLDKKYDFIVHDCFTGGSEPIHLLSIEMLRTVKSRLRKDGILALNFVGFTTGQYRDTVDAVARTIDEIFQFKRTFVSAPGETFNDFIFFASDHPIELPTSDQKISRWLAHREIEVSGERGLILTDDFNPLESMQIAKAERYRELLKKRVGKKILFW